MTMHLNNVVDCKINLSEAFFHTVLVEYVSSCN